MMNTPFRRRLALVASAGLIAGGLGAVGHATADPIDPAHPAVEPVAANVDDEYWACLALDHVEIGTCLSNPLPDLSDAETLDDVIQAVLNDL